MFTVGHPEVNLCVLQVDERELHFLVLHLLAAGPCQQAAAVLEKEALEHELLPTRTDIFGKIGLSEESWS